MKQRILLLMITALLSVGAWAADDVTLSTDYIVLGGGGGSYNSGSKTLWVAKLESNGWEFYTSRPISTTEFSGVTIDYESADNVRLVITYEGDITQVTDLLTTTEATVKTIPFQQEGIVREVKFTSYDAEDNSGGNIVFNSVKLNGISGALIAYPTSNMTLTMNKMKDAGQGATYNSENQTITIGDNSWSGWLLNLPISTKYYKGIRFTLTQAPAAHGSIKIDYDEGDDAWISTDNCAGGGTISYDFTGDRNITQISFNGGDWQNSGNRTYGISTCYIEPKPITATVTDVKWATYGVNAAIDYSATSGLKAYIAYVEDGKVKLTEVSKVPANTAVILYADVDESTSYTLTPTAETTGDVSANKLHVSDGTKTGDGSTIYVLANKTPVGFYKLSSSATVPAGKAYLQISGGVASAPAFIGFGNGTTGIQTIDNGKLTNDNVYYDLQGRRVAQPTKGLYIVNGKKVVIK